MIHSIEYGNLILWEEQITYLVDVAPGTEKISTTKPVFLSSNDEWLEKVMQTAAVG
jgi:hypothetical protein